MDLKLFAKKVFVVLLATLVFLAGYLVFSEALRRDDVRHCEQRIIQVQNFPLDHLSEWEIEMCLEFNVDIPSDVLGR